MAKNKDLQNNNLNDILNGDLGAGGMPTVETKENKPLSVFITILIIVIWLGIFLALIKLDVGGFGSKVLYPVLKDVPVINKILPDVKDKEKLEDIPYKSIAECASYIKELENEIAGYQQSISEKDSEIADLQAEAKRLKQFEDNQKTFEEEKAKYYEEVVFGEKAVDAENYIEYYRSIDPENAELLYQRAIEKYAYDEQVKARAKYYSSMKPDKAAAIFCEMTGDLDIVVALLNSMDAKSSGAIIGAMADIDSVFAAKVTKKLMP